MRQRQLRALASRLAQVAALSAALERFRFAAGLLLAVILGLQMVTIALAFRSR